MKKNRKKYDFVFKEKAVLLIYERNCSSLLEKELGLYHGALSIWRKEYEKFNKDDSLGNLYLKLNLEKQKICELEKKIKKSDAQFEILKNAGKYLYQKKYIIFDFILRNEKIYSIRLMSETLGINRREYQRWKKQPMNETQKRKILIEKEITSIFFSVKRRYGSERIAIELQNSGYKIAGRTVRKYMRELGLSSKVKNN